MQPAHVRQGAVTEPAGAGARYDLVLRLEAAPPDVDLARRVGGLSLPLRLALAAQAAGAKAIELGPGAERCGDLLVDPRLRVPVLASAPAARAPLVLRAPAHLVVHRAHLAALVAARRGAREIDAREGPDSPPPFGFAPILVTDARTAREAERALLRSLRKAQDGYVSRYLNRPVSLAVTRRLARTSVPPNAVTLAILAVGALAAWLASRGDPGSLLVAAALFHAQSVLDGCDGELARLTYRTSRTGEWLDTIGDDLTNYGFFAGAAIGLERAGSDLAPLVAGTIVVVAGALTSAIQYRYLIGIGSGDLLRYPLGVGTTLDGASPSGPAGTLLRVVATLCKRDTFVLLTFVAAALGALAPVLWAFAAGALAILVQTLRAEARRARRG